MLGVLVFMMTTQHWHSCIYWCDWSVPYCCCGL